LSHSAARPTAIITTIDAVVSVVSTVACGSIIDDSVLYVIPSVLSVGPRWRLQSRAGSDRAAVPGQKRGGFGRAARAAELRVLGGCWGAAWVACCGQSAVYGFMAACKKVRRFLVHFLALYGCLHVCDVCS